MPLYSYICSSCGEFSDWQSITASAEPAACPQCGGASRRAVTAPTILSMDPHRRIAHARNEKSAHEPKVVRAEDLKPHDHRHDHHHHHHGGGMHVHQSSRPWMIGH